MGHDIHVTVWVGHSSCNSVGGSASVWQCGSVVWCGGCSRYREVCTSASSRLPSTARLEQVSAIHAQITRERNHLPKGEFISGRANSLSTLLIGYTLRCSVVCSRPVASAAACGSLHYNILSFLQLCVLCVCVCVCVCVCRSSTS